MGEKYLFSQTGVVEEIYLPGKAVITFQLYGQTQRVLLWVKCFLYQGKMLDKCDSLIGKLNIGDFVNFDCHTYDKESTNNCNWYAARASKEPLEDSGNIAKNTPKVINQSGYISEVEPGKGVILFNFFDEEQRVFFMRSKVFLFGKRPKRSLKEFMSENDPLQFDAEMCEPTADNFHCNWFATVVWKGKKPQVLSGPGLMSLSGPYIMSDDLTADDSASNAGGIGRGDIGTLEDFPTLAMSSGVSERIGYKAFEASGTVREGRGNVLALYGEECGLALWLVRPNTWETVFFHRSHAALDTVSLANFDLQESLAEGTSLDICAVPAIPEFPCRWIAKHVVAHC